MRSKSTSACDRPLRFLVFMLVGVVAGAGFLFAHEAHMLIGRSTSGQLKWHPGDGVPHQALTVLALIPPGGPIQGYSASIPGFSLVPTASVEDDCHPLAAGADVWLRIVAADEPLLIIETPTYVIVNERHPPEMRIGSDLASHMHPLWLLDTTDPAFDARRCVWEVSFVLIDKGTTGYAVSEPITLRFSAGQVPCPGDLDCDADVDAEDLALFQACLTGPAIPYNPANLPAGCTLLPDHGGLIRADLDRDGDVDQSDFGLLQCCLTGEGVPGDPACAN